MRTRKLFRITFGSPARWLLMTLLIVWICASSSALASVVKTPTSEFQQRLQSRLEAKLKEMKVPGATIFVQSERTGAWTTSLGVSDLKTREPMHANLHFRVGSITKTFTGTVILQLVDEGKLGLDDPVSQYRREVPNGTHITIRQLLNMRSGLYNYTDDQNFGQTLVTHPDRVWKPQELLSIAFKHQPYFAPNKGFHYSNTNTILLGLIIEQITGRSVEHELEQRIFAPLGMKHSLLPPRTSAILPAPYARGYILQSSIAEIDKRSKSTNDLVDVSTWNPSWGWTAGAAVSTLPDLRIWAKALATGKLLSPAMQKERLTWVAKVANIAQYGLAIADFRGYIGHNGELPGYQSFEGYMPEKKATVIVLTNLTEAPDGSKPADTLATIIIKDLAS
jgi:D-alanyl-D-alanine carboxypeptidase